ncbi:MAG TPA: hypothetical protein VGW38_22290 [Chloroflexota bacterium]|nr:hypothetical protein [Chloroflexota bacterium]
MSEPVSEVWRELCRLADGARSCVAWHAGRMDTDPEYRAIVERLTEWLSARPGWLGQAARGVVDGHTVLVKLL